MMGNAVVEFQILSKTPDETATFYCELFGWSVSADNPLGYRQLDTGTSEGIRGGVWPAPPQAPDFVQLFIRVNDIHESIARAVRLGGRVLIPATTLPEGAEMAVLQDPKGLSVAIVRR